MITLVAHFDDAQDANSIHRIDEIRFNYIEVKYVLLSLDPGKATGSDGISNIILRECASELASQLCDLFNASLSSSTVPFSWKQANVCAVHKKMTNHVPTATDQFHCYVVWKRYLSD